MDVRGWFGGIKVGNSDTNICMSINTRSLLRLYLCQGFPIALSLSGMSLARPDEVSHQALQTVIDFAPAFTARIAPRASLTNQVRLHAVGKAPMEYVTVHPSTPSPPCDSVAALGLCGIFDLSQPLPTHVNDDRIG